MLLQIIAFLKTNGCQLGAYFSEGAFKPGPWQIRLQTKRNKMAISVQIVEKSKAAYDLIKYWIENTGFKKFTFLPYAAPEDAGGIFLSEKPDVLVIDLSISKIFNYGTAGKLNKNPTKVIVLAAREGMEAIQQFIEIGISALVMKPVQQDPFTRAVAKVVDQINAEEEKPTPGQFVSFRSNQSMLYLNELDIVFIESDRNSSKLTLKNGECQTVHEGILGIEQHLKSRELLKVDKSTIINLSRITYLGEDVNGGGCLLRLNNGSEIRRPLSKVALSSLYKIFPQKNSSVSVKGQDCNGHDSRAAW
jgi:DNA-binding LytR/AlgR family response regulator